MNSKDHPVELHVGENPSSHAGKRSRRNIVALGSAAVLAAYTAGFWRTAPATHPLALSEKKRLGVPDRVTVHTVQNPLPAVSAPTAAPAPVDRVTPPRETATTVPEYKDGVYAGWGHCRHGDLQVSVTIEGGRIIAAAISQCHTRYSKNVIAKLPPQVISRQSPKVDWVSGATESSEAFFDAVLAALSQAK